MSLIAHYRLDGDAKDSLGRYHGTPTDVTWTTGKLGQCGNFNGTSSIVDFDTFFPTEWAQHFTICAWINIPSSYTWNTSRWSNICSRGSYTGSNGLAMSRVNNRVALWMRAANGAVAAYGMIERDRWHHICGVWKSTHIEFYVDGVQTGSSAVAERDGIPNAGNWSLGRAKAFSGSAGSMYAGQVDDVRLYDHALSPREVRDLAQAKVLHYKFDNFAEPTENLILTDEWNSQGGSGGSFSWKPFWASQTITIETTDLLKSGSNVIKSVINETRDGGPAYRDIVVPTLTAGITFTVTAYVKSQGRRIRIWPAAGNQVYSPYNTAGHGWERLETTVLSDTTGSIRIHFRFEAGNIGDIVWVTAPQLEEKDHATSFVNGTRDGVVTDASSQDNHATLALATTPQWVEDSKIGSGAYEFDGVDDVISHNINTSVHVQTAYTATMWVKFHPEAIGKDSRFYWHGNYGILLYKQTNENITFYLRNNSNTVQIGAGAGSVTANVWYHIAAVFDGTTMQLYINGVLVADGAQTGPVIDAQPYRFAIGAATNGSYAAHISMDDVRVYSTALSAAEIQEIYQQRASLDSEGSFHVQELNQQNKRDHGNSDWYAMTSGTYRYAAPYPDTQIIEVSGSSRTMVVNSSNPSSGTLSATAGNTYYGTKPIHLIQEGNNHAVVPLSMIGTKFANYYSRYAPITFHMHSPYHATVVRIYDGVSNGIDGTPTQTISISQGGSATYETSNYNWVYFDSDKPIIMSSMGVSGDKMIMMPASKDVYVRRNNNKITMKGNSPSTISSYHVRDDDLCVSMEIADGAGGDATQGLGLNHLSKVFAFGNALSDYHIVAPHSDTDVDVLYYDGSTWVLGEHHSLNGSVLSPAYVFRDGTAGFGVPGTNVSGNAAYLGGAATLWRFVSSQPILVTINDTADNEEILLGWTHDGYR